MADEPGGQPGPCKPGRRIRPATIAAVAAALASAAGRGHRRRPPGSRRGIAGTRVHDVVHLLAAAPPLAAGDRRRRHRSGGQPDDLVCRRPAGQGRVRDRDRPAAVRRLAGDRDVAAQADQHAAAQLARHAAAAERSAPSPLAVAPRSRQVASGQPQQPSAHLTWRQPGSGPGTSSRAAGTVPTDAAPTDEKSRSYPSAPSAAPTVGSTGRRSSGPPPARLRWPPPGHGSPYARGPARRYPADLRVGSEPAGLLVQPAEFAVYRGQRHGQAVRRPDRDPASVPRASRSATATAGSVPARVHPKPARAAKRSRVPPFHSRAGPRRPRWAGPRYPRAGSMSGRARGGLAGHRGGDAGAAEAATGTVTAVCRPDLS